MGSYKWVISPLIWLISIVTLIITPFISTHEPPSSWGLRRGCSGVGFREGRKSMP